MGTMTAISDTQGQPMYREHAIQQLTTIFGSHLSSLTRMATRIMSDADAEDAVQDAFLLAYKHVDEYRGQAKMSTWVTAIVINAARMKVRARSRQLHISLDQENREQEHRPLSEILPDRRSSPEQLYRSWELTEHLAQASTQLSPALRGAFQLTHVEGLGIHETAQIMGITPSAVKSRVARARKKLKQVLQAH
jgi:RNA polymerase sigma-70 factor (ECF subfamily)